MESCVRLSELVIDVSTALSTVAERSGADSLLKLVPNHLKMVWRTVLFEVCLSVCLSVTHFRLLSAGVARSI